MSRTIEITDAQATLNEIIASLGPNDEVVIVQGQKPVARIVAPRKGRPQFGGCKGMLTIEEEDSEHLRDFEEYMP